ncbi:hypothetical protein HPB52_005154 [Rhipicephalus sanguineus]|uniref:Uncharacterized protein n=1 Tax=Rhipicephalus sanguineus TaxID=34632 RepID=A0A9D4PUB7_RHISA|nr:hypothetical protein HPB52_005154 [Rhipicephalus sanguineus]
MAKNFSDAAQPDEADVLHAGYAMRESVDVDELRSTCASSRARSVPSERRARHDEVVAVAMGAVADQSHDDEIGRISETPLVSPDHGGVGCCQGGVHGYGSSTEPAGAIFRTRNYGSGTRECDDKADVAPSSDASQPLRAPSHSMSDKSLPTQQSNLDRTHSNLNGSTADANCDGQPSQASRSRLSPSKGTEASSRTNASSPRDKKSALELRDTAISRNRNNVLRNSTSESRCECPARKNSSSPNLRLNQGTFPASHMCTEAGRRRPKQVLSAEECRKARGMVEKDPTSRKRKLPPQAIPLDLKDTTVASLALETRCRVTKDALVLKPKGVLSVILDTENTKKISASFDDADKTLLAENPPDKSSKVKGVRAAGVSAAWEGNATFAPVEESDVGSEVNANHGPVHVDFPEADAGIDITCNVRCGQSAEERILSTDSTPSTALDSTAAAQFSMSPEQSESLPLYFDAESRSSSTQTGTSGSHQMREETANNSNGAQSSDSAQLSPQPELSFLLSDVLSGSAANTNVSWSAVALFRDNTALSLWGGPPTAANDATIVAAGEIRAKGASVPDRPTSPETDVARTPSPFGRAKRTVSCPLSFDAESVCYETGDQEAFTPRQSSSNCWCCDKNERALEHKQSSAHMPVDEYLRLKERLDQRPHTPALWEDSKSEQSDIERDLDMATLDCSVAGFEQYSHVELFCHVSSSSAKSRAVDSLEQWLNEGVEEGYDNYADECHGTSRTLSFADDYNVVSIGSDNSEIAIGDASYRESITGETTREEIDTLNQEAGNADDATPASIQTFADCGEPEVQNISTKWPSPKETRKRMCQPRETENMADEGDNAATVANGDLNLVPSVPPPEVLAMSYVNTRYNGIELAEALNEFATGLSLKDVVFIPRRQTRTGVTPMPRLDDVDFSKFVPDDALSVQESLARMPKIICKGTLRK